MSAAELGRIVVTYELGDAPAHDIETSATIIGEIPVTLAVGLLAMASDTILRGKHGTGELEAVQTIPKLDARADDVKRGEFPPPMFDLDAGDRSALAEDIREQLESLREVRLEPGDATPWVSEALDVVVACVMGAIPDAQVETLNPEVLARAMHRERMERMSMVNDPNAFWERLSTQARNARVKEAERVLAIIAEETTA